jgi:hypothetical protein
MLYNPGFPVSVRAKRWWGEGIRLFSPQVTADLVVWNYFSDIASAASQNVSVWRALHIKGSEWKMMGWSW